MRIAITGYHGFFASRLARMALSRGHTVVALCRRPILDSVEHLLFDMPDFIPTSVQLESLRIDALVHCAWDFSPKRLAECIRTNVSSAARLISAAHAANVGLIVGISTMSAFDGCRSIYGRSKLEMERIIIERGGAVLRPGLLWGAGAGGVMGSLEKFAQWPICPVITSGGKLYLTNVDDLTTLTIMLMERGILPPIPITAANPQAYDLRGILRILARRRGRQLLLFPVPATLAWIGLRGFEFFNNGFRLRSDSVTGLVHTDPVPHFDPAWLRAHGLPRFRPFNQDAAQADLRS